MAHVNRNRLIVLGHKDGFCWLTANLYRLSLLIPAVIIGRNRFPGYHASGTGIGASRLLRYRRCWLGKFRVKRPLGLKILGEELILIRDGGSIYFASRDVAHLRCSAVEGKREFPALSPLPLSRVDLQP